MENTQGESQNERDANNSALSITKVEGSGELRRNCYWHQDENQGRMVLQGTREDFQNTNEKTKKIPLSLVIKNQFWNVTQNRFDKRK